jgi:hypothetical protein
MPRPFLVGLVEITDGPVFRTEARRWIGDASS